MWDYIRNIVSCSFRNSDVDEIFIAPGCAREDTRGNARSPPTILPPDRHDVASTAFLRPPFDIYPRELLIRDESNQLMNDSGTPTIMMLCAMPCWQL